eukprot:CAMPEP_0172475214 /NCGR_PEP_ID=MMETSP1065-20121228/69754_1 /TAXON_ID=265537 /ORGANISM="Amphiprora paludosa, Strain CCMP125" /LENGTH=510 /DNA_ID=CAMNT_0013233411 /DNA_START=297 /DNA_END=1829 /DNA_ORIENTATION=-
MRVTSCVRAWSKMDNNLDTPNNRQDSTIPWSSVAMVTLPGVGATVFPTLLQWAKSLPVQSLEQLAVVTVLFVTSRAFLYGNAAVIVALAAQRGAQDVPLLGQRVTDLTEELLYRPNLLTETLDMETENTIDFKQETKKQPPREETRSKPKLIQQLSTSGVQESLDQVSAERQALLLPLLVSALLAVSVFWVPFGDLLVNTKGSSLVSDNDDISLQLQLLFQKFAPYISQAWNAGLLTLFSRAELRRLQKELVPSINTDDNYAAAGLEWGLAAGITAVACFTPFWPIQNWVNMALAIAVSRVIQLDSLIAVLGGLLLLTIYDASSVFLIPSASAATAIMDHGITTMSGIDNNIVDSSSAFWLAAGGTQKAISDSAMGSVALQKLTSGTFQPGLLVTKIDDRFLGGSLGLGDAVFPSLLATFVRRFDVTQDRLVNKERNSLLKVALVGYLLGCAACEFVPLGLASTCLPALLFIIPIMVGSVLAAASFRGELDALWKFRASEETTNTVQRKS